MSIQREEKRPAMGWLRYNWKIKILSLVLALAAFAAIRQVNSEQGSFTVSVEVTGLPSGWIMDYVVPVETSVTLQGSREQLSRIGASSIVATVDLRSVSLPEEGGEVVVPLSWRNLSEVWRRGVRILDIHPGAVSVMIDREAEMALPVARPALHGVPLTGTATVAWNDGTTVSVRSSKRVLDMLAAQNIHLRTDEVDVANRVIQDFTQRVRVHLPVGVSGIVTPEEIDVHVQIVREVPEEATEETPAEVIEEAPAEAIEEATEEATDGDE